MSASRMPTLRPSAASPSARLHEVVDLPTPPLPEATAMMCFTPGMPASFEVAGAGFFGPLRIGVGPGAGSRFRGPLRLVGGEAHQRARDAGKRLDDPLGGGAHGLKRIHLGGIDGDGEDHLAVVGDDVGQPPRCGQALAIGQSHGVERAQDVVAVHGHECFSGSGTSLRGR